MLAAAVLTVLSGCGTGLSLGHKQAKATVGWYCVDNAETGIKDCEKRLLRDGVPVSNVVYERLGAEAEPLAIEAAPPASPLTAINALDDGGGLKVENQGPPPRQVRAYMDRSGKAAEAEENGEL